MLFCVAGSVFSVRHLETTDHTSAYAVGGTRGQTYGGVVKATQYSSAEGLNAIKEEVTTACKAIHILMPAFISDRKVLCYKVYHAILPEVQALSMSLAKAFASSTSTAYSAGGGVACAGGASKSQAIQCVEVLRYALYSTSWTAQQVNSILDLMEPDFVAAFAGAHSKACTKLGYAVAYQTSLAEAVDKELHKLFPMLHYGRGYACGGEYSVQEVDKSNAVTKGETSLSGYSEGGSGGLAFATQGDAVKHNVFDDFDDHFYGYGR